MGSCVFSINDWLYWPEQTSDLLGWTTTTTTFSIEIPGWEHWETRQRVYEWQGCWLLGVL